MPAKRNDTRSVGFRGERYAEKLLKDSGYKILQRNYYSKVGEIDIIAKDGDTLVFIEVKLRKTKKFGMPEEAVTSRKLRKIEKAGQYYVKENNIKIANIRIDVVSLLFEDNKLIRKKLIKAAYL